MFSSLGLIDIQTEKLEQEDSMIFIGFECTRETLPAIGYVFYEYWEESFPKETEITSNQLGNLGFRNAFAWSELEELEILERMSDYGLIRLNKQLMPFTIIRLKEKKDIEKELYIELF